MVFGAAQTQVFSHPTVDRSDHGDGGWVFADEGSSPPLPHLYQYEIRQAGDTLQALITQLHVLCAS